MWTTRRLLAWMGPYFESRGLDAPRLVAEMLLAHVLDCDRMRLYMEADRPAAAEELATLRALVARAAKHEPVQYLIGQARFYGRDFAVTPHVFIPQPCTEEIVSVVSEWFGRGGRTSVDGEEPANDGGADAGPLFADVGTGSGCLAVSLALQVPRARVVATDADEAALEVARGNAERFGVTDRLAFVIGSLLEPVRAWMDEGGDAPDGAASGAGAGPFPRAGGRFDVICSNPPYIPDHEWEGGQVQEAVRKYVPQRALRGGRDGLDFIRPLIAGAGSVLKSGGRLVIEIADCQRDAVLDLVEKAPGLGNAEVRRDHEGLWRIFVAERVRSA
ncbi:MAG: peptide chain release factor N(5)-glutamine methyltransferase [Planctomycetota bacterium]|nr:peptide chain release factor N(5)-glutamine methyltransferase [Planctomycetota bacterium]